MKRAVTKISDRDIKTNLREWINEAMNHPEIWNAGIDWYKEAQDFCESTAIAHWMDSYDVAVITAILSPKQQVGAQQGGCNHSHQGLESGS